jgi:hypothetical protein
VIDLSIKGLPDRVTVAGKSFLVLTDFRDWLKFDYKISHGENISILDFAWLLPEVDKLTLLTYADEFFMALIEFYKNPNSTPRATGNSTAPAVDYSQDGEYIYAAFKQAYNIDLVDVDGLHWHKFKALFLSLPENTKMSEIMRLRTWERTKKDSETLYAEARDAWALPREKTAEEEETIKAINDLFYNC